MPKKKIVFISGSSSGIGFHLAKLFKEKNYTIIINGRDSKKLKRAAVKLGNCNYIIGDLTKEKNIIQITKTIKKKYNYIDLLICNQGNSDFKNNNLNFKFAFDNNFFSTINLISNSKKILRRNSSKIICISSICGTEAINGAPHGYSVAKSALNFYIKNFSYELAKDGISINGVVPGNIFFEGSTWYKKMIKNSKKTKKYIKDNVPINKFGSIEDIFAICKTISDDTSNYLTGSLFKIDGGQTKSL
mgnify:CR=1 FL=1|jgi:NAD(P)-dependent dehydrogenase (short-subunit alcohol dehydrogenase family)|tara:strand:+ start:3373 stop:4110 length:738 start_codon:yes stop_codon:yes gene_type:complete